jgi:hypothetical protein
MNKKSHHHDKAAMDSGTTALRLRLSTVNAS